MTNIFDKTVETLINDAEVLDRKYHDLINNGKTREAIDIIRLLKDTLSLIKEYDWHLEYSEYETDGHKEIAVWEQNHSGEIRNHKKWAVNGYLGTVWYRTFLHYIVRKESYLVNNNISSAMRGSGKSETIAKLCHGYNGIIVFNSEDGLRGIHNRNIDFGYDDLFVTYKDYIKNINKYKNMIVLLDEGHGLNSDEIDKIKENNLVIGFME